MNITSNLISAFYYFLPKSEENKLTPIANEIIESIEPKIDNEEGRIIGSKINTLVIENFRNRELRYYNEELDTYCKEFDKHNVYSEDEVEEKTDNPRYDAVHNKRSFPKDTLHSKGTVMHHTGPYEASTVNYTQHKMNLYRFNGYYDHPNCVYLDKFLVYKGISALWMQIMQVKGRPDLLYIQAKDTPIKLIVLEKVGKNYVISWEADAKDFGVPVKDQPHNFEFSIKKIDSTSFRKNVCPLLLFANEKDENSPFANLPTEIVHQIGMLGIGL